MGHEVLNLLGDDDFEESAEIHPQYRRQDISEMPRDVQWLMLNIRHAAMLRGPNASGLSYTSGKGHKGKARFGGKRNTLNR